MYAVLCHAVFLIALQGFETLPLHDVIDTWTYRLVSVSLMLRLSVHRGNSRRIV